MESAMKNANPHYYEGVEYQINCQRCIYAYEMQRRGYDVEALPNFRQDNLSQTYAADGWPKVMDGTTLIDMPGRKTIKAMVERMSQWGDGARAVVDVVWKGKKSGHVFIAEQQGIATVFLDPQTGQNIDIHQYMDAAIKKYTKLARIDNLKPTALIEKCVKRREKK